MKKSQFANVVNHEGKALIHNALFGGVIKAGCDDSRNFLDVIDSGNDFEIDINEGFHVALKDMRMIVDNDMDESALANYYFVERQRHELFIIPFVTKQCNFRCVYCLDKFSNDRMEESTYDDLLKVIEDLIDTKGYKTVRISFFGGEPLLEYEAICRFSEKLNELVNKKEVQFIGGMTTNGHLLTIDRLKRLTELNVTEYQITVDGLKESHDVARPLVSGNGTWDTIMQNLYDAKASELEFMFMIRSNFDNALHQIAKNYLEHMSQHFAGDTRFTFSFVAVKQLKGGEKNIDTVSAEEEIDITDEMRMLASGMGLNVSGSQLITMPFGYVCYANSNDSFTIDYDGTVMKCTVQTESAMNRIGSLSGGNLDIKDHLLSHWTSRGLQEKCKSCKILSICYNGVCPAATITDGQCNKNIVMYEDALKAMLI